jgi:hypothetical protein
MGKQKTQKFYGFYWTKTWILSKEIGKYSTHGSHGSFSIAM